MKSLNFLELQHCIEPAKLLFATAAGAQTISTLMGLSMQVLFFPILPSK